jgi:hypothetical protein
MTINGKSFPVNSKDTSFRIKSDFKKPLTFQNKYKNRRPIIKISSKQFADQDVSWTTISRNQLNLSGATIAQSISET